MWEDLRHAWRDVRRFPPGRRFQLHYRQRHGMRRSPWRRRLILIISTLIIALGIFLLPVPGPGSVVIIAGAALLAQESVMVARLLDRAELLGRRLIRAVLRWWGRSSWVAKALLVSFCAMLAGLTILLGYQVLFT